MEKIQIFFGPAGSGKTKKILELAEGKKSVFLNGRNLYYQNFAKFFYQDLDLDTELLIIDNVPISDIKNLMYFLFDDRIVVNKQSKTPFEMIRPKTIITVCSDKFQLSKGAAFTERFEIIEFKDMNTSGRHQVCKVCGCTDDDCSQCIAKTGEPCSWVEDDLCSACKTN